MVKVSFHTTDTDELIKSMIKATENATKVTSITITLGDSE